MDQFHFTDLAYSDNAVTAMMATPVAVDTYHFKHKTYPDIYIRNRGLAMHLSFLDDDSDEIKALREAVEEYNEYLTKLEEIPGFVEYFKQHGFCVSREEVTDKWSEGIADYVFSKKAYCFDTELTIIHDYLFDSSISVMYQATIENCPISIPIGKPDTDYPDMINGKKAFWNWVDNGHDFCFNLWMLLGERESQNDESIDDDDAVHYYFDAYDQIRDEYIEPQLANVFRHLQNCGYIQTYTIRPITKDPRWNCYGKTDGSIDLALVDMSFLNDEILMKQVEYQLWKPLDKEYVEIDIECDSEKEDGNIA